MEWRGEEGRKWTLCQQAPIKVRPFLNRREPEIISFLPLELTIVATIEATVVDTVVMWMRTKKKRENWPFKDMSIPGRTETSF